MKTYMEDNMPNLTAYDPYIHWRAPKAPPPSAVWVGPVNRETNGADFVPCYLPSELAKLLNSMADGKRYRVTIEGEQ